jgi:hypothetical protein
VRNPRREDGARDYSKSCSSHESNRQSHRFQGERGSQKENRLRESEKYQCVLSLKSNRVLLPISVVDYSYWQAPFVDYSHAANNAVVYARLHSPVDTEDAHVAIRNPVLSEQRSTRSCGSRLRCYSALHRRGWRGQVLSRGIPRSHASASSEQFNRAHFPSM